MQVTILTNTGRMARLKSIKNKSGLNHGNLCSAEIQGFSGAKGGHSAVIEDLLGSDREQIFCMGCVSDFSPVLAGGEFLTPVPTEAIGTAYGVEASLQFIKELFCQFSSYKYGEFCFFASDLSYAALANEVSKMTRIDTLSLLSNLALKPTWLIGFDIESDTATIASRSQNDILAIIANRLI